MLTIHMSASAPFAIGQVSGLMEVIRSHLRQAGKLPTVTHTARSAPISVLAEMQRQDLGEDASHATGARP